MIKEIVHFEMSPYSGVNLYTNPNAVYLDPEIDCAMFICFYPYYIAGLTGHTEQSRFSMDKIGI